MLGVYKMSLFDLTGKSILITGSSKGIGKSIATRYAEYGAKVIISSRTSETCMATADEINSNLGKELAYPIPCNISHQEQLEEAFKPYLWLRQSALPISVRLNIFI